DLASTQVYTPIRCPQVSQEQGYAPFGLCKDAFRHKFLVRSQAEQSHLIEPCCYRVPHTMSELIAGCEIYLIPIELTLNTWCNSHAEYLHRQISDDLGERDVVGRVVDRLARPMTTVADHIAEQAQFCIRPSGFGRCRAIAWNP